MDSSIYESAKRVVLRRHELNDSDIVATALRDALRPLCPTAIDVRVDRVDSLLFVVIRATITTTATLSEEKAAAAFVVSSTHFAGAFTKPHFTEGVFDSLDTRVPIPRHQRLLRIAVLIDDRDLAAILHHIDNRVSPMQVCHSSNEEQSDERQQQQVELVHCDTFERAAFYALRGQVHACIVSPSAASLLSPVVVSCFEVMFEAGDGCVSAWRRSDNNGGEGGLCLSMIHRPHLGI
jgi:hypothetical protein